MTTIYGTIDVVQCFNLVKPALLAIPSPAAGAIIGTLDSVLQAVEEARDNKNQLKLLFYRVCDILKTLSVPQNYGDKVLESSVDTLIANLESIRDLAISLKQKNVFKMMLQSGDIRLKIEELERKSSAFIQAHKKLDSLWEQANNHEQKRVSAQQFQEANSQDQNEQLAMIRQAVASMSSGTPSMLDEILQTINVDPNVTITGMTVLLERHDIGKIKLRDVEVMFLRAGIARLNEQKSAKDGRVETKSWMVTSWEVDRGFLLGSDPTSFIRAGRWLGDSVGIVELKDVATTLKFVKIWKHLRSNRIQGFLGASTVDNPPFILTQPLHLNIAEYVKVTDKPNLRRLILETVRALDYLHTRAPPVVHGGLRPKTIQRVASRSEVLDGALATPESDIFSLGVILKELITLIQEKHSNRAFSSLNSIASRCQAPNPSSRPNTQDLIQELEDRDSKDEISDLLAMLPSTTDVSEVTGLQNIDRWRVVPYISKIHKIFTEDDDRLYIASAPLQGVSEHPLRQITVEVKCHDQGREYTTAHQRDGVWTWIELALLRQRPDGRRMQVNLNEALPGQPRGFMIADTRYEIIRLPFADSTPRVHRTNLDWRNPFIKEARRGDVIAFHPKARFPGWANHVYSAEMHVVTE
ncbi:hypothetical protein D9757_009935 [Collybiopsis confluens]|uniref:Protein kinase domain-containing protein n=1 Tax=Collybiopsis confluens TaxID=2823264 RepID=A0A8H5LZV6_9AGAR|nr:hypothetical protein D9757_009935 [Collybiopsis confluens]